MMESERRRIFRAIASRRFGAPSTWHINGRPDGWHLDRPCTPEEACMHDNGINDALMALNELPAPTAGQE
jgi:hypothetical protein